MGKERLVYETFATANQKSVAGYTLCEYILL